MSQYQSFPDAAGASRTLDKLKALHLPDMAGKRFLDVGCNEGFFCGFARFQGAARVVGIDRSVEFIRRARARFPECELLVQGWDQLPEGPFDAILLASAIHYADDQPALIEDLMSVLARDGVLVLEMGIVSSDKPEWVKVTRGIDERYFPSMAELERVLAGYAWKWMGPSVSQDGDPVARHVIHVRHRLPVAYLLMQPPGLGKSSIARNLFSAAGITVVSGDSYLDRIAKGTQSASGSLADAVAKDFSPFTLDQTIHRLFSEGHGSELVRLWMTEVASGDVAIDAYVPAEFHGLVTSTLEELGYLPVAMHWTPVGASPMPDDVAEKLGEAFYLSMTAADEAGGDREFAATGFVDEIQFGSERISVRGWAVDSHGNLPGQFIVQMAGKAYEVVDFERQLRPDVQQHLGLPHGLIGYRLHLANPSLKGIEDLRGSFMVSVPGGSRLRLSGPLSEIIG
jgi:SAM-dependent methyltransferase